MPGEEAIYKAGIKITVGITYLGVHLIKVLWYYKALISIQNIPNKPCIWRKQRENKE